MMNRSLGLAVGFVAAATAAASASPDYGLDLSAGGGASVMTSDPCDGPSVPANCTTPSARIVGPSAHVRGMFGARHALRHGWGLVWGAGITASFMTESAGSGEIVSPGGEFGVSFDRFTAVGFAGLSYVRMHTDAQMTAEHGATFAFGGSLNVAVTPQVGVYARVDLSAMMEGVIGGASAGAGLSLHL